MCAYKVIKGCCKILSRNKDKRQKVVKWWLTGAVNDDGDSKETLRSDLELLKIYIDYFIEGNVKFTHSDIDLMLAEMLRCEKNVKICKELKLVMCLSK